MTAYVPFAGAQKLLYKNAWSIAVSAEAKLPTELLQQACTFAHQQAEGHTEQTVQQAVAAMGPTATSSWSCQLAASIVLNVMSLAMQRHPAQTALHASAEYQDAVSWLLLHGGLSLQTAALEHTTAMLKTLPRLPLHALAGAVGTSLSTWTEFPPQQASILQPWATAVCACIAQLLDSAAAAHQVPAVASGLAPALMSAIASATWDAQLQTCLCSALVSLARLWPCALADLPTLTPLAASNQALGLHLVRCLALLAEGTAAAGALDAAAPMYGDAASQEQVTPLHGQNAWLCCMSWHALLPLIAGLNHLQPPLHDCATSLTYQLTRQLTSCKIESLNHCHAACTVSWVCSKAENV